MQTEHVISFKTDKTLKNFQRLLGTEKLLNTLLHATQSSWWQSVIERCSFVIWPYNIFIKRPIIFLPLSLLRFFIKYKDGAQHYHHTLCPCFLWVGHSQVFGRPIHNGKYLIFSTCACAKSVTAQEESSFHGLRSTAEFFGLICLLHSLVELQNLNK